MLRIRAMTPDDVTLGMRLKTQAGWNQTEADWRRALDLEPEGCFVAERDGVSVGTTTTCRFGPVAWVAMVLVDPAARGQGVGTALMKHALEWLERRGARSVRLDATPLGRPVYEKLGFVPEYQLDRYEGIVPARGPVDGAEAVRPGQVEELARLDETITGADRRKLLFRLYAERPEAFRVARLGRELGFLAARPGARAVQIGPCLAPAVLGERLLADAWYRYAGHPVFLDVPTGHPAAIRLAESAGLAVQRHLLRMVRGERVPEMLDQLWASSGPEKG